MKTKQEIKEEIIELYGATQALGDAMNILHAQRMEKSKQMMALNQMLKDMDDDAKEKRTWVGLMDEEIDQGLLRTKYAMQTAGAWRDGVEWAIKQLQERNT